MEIAAIKSHIRSLSREEFVSSLPAICDNLQKQQNILLFGFIIYDESMPQYRKFRRDPVYWRALERISGDKMMLFALSDKVDSRWEGNDINQPMTSFGPSGFSRTKCYSCLLNEVFADKSSLVYPSVLFFQVVEGTIYNYRLVPLRRSTVEESFSAVQGLFETIAKNLAKITPENYPNYRVIFELVKNDLLNEKYAIYILRGPKALEDFIDSVKDRLFFT